MLKEFTRDMMETYEMSGIGLLHYFLATEAC